MSPAEDSARFSTIGLGRGIGEMEDRIRGVDWSLTPLGPVDRWPQSLRTAVNILLSSRYSMWMAWGRDLTMLYNDAYRPTLGIKHPRALGRKASEVWPEIWPEIGPLIQTVLTTGEATYEEGLFLILERSGFPEETYHTFSYSPLADDDDRISGLLCVVTEETDRLIGERRVETLRDLASALASTNSEDEVLQALRNQLSRNMKDVPFALTYLFEEDNSATLASSSGFSDHHPLAPAKIGQGENFPWPAHDLLLRPAPLFFEDLDRQRKVAPLPSGAWNKPVHQAAVVPIKQQGQDRPAGFFVVGVNPYRRYDTAYIGFVDLLAGQIAAGLGNARAYEAERKRAEALTEIDRAKTTFFSNVSHELRTPLTLMLSPMEELLSGTCNLTPDERELLELVYRNGLRLQKLVNALLDFARIEAGRIQATYELTDLGRFTEDLAANFRSAMDRAGLAFTVECEPLPEPVYVDREMWEKIVLNLLSNALKFTLEGSVSVTLRPAGAFAELKVQDSGSGIPEADIPHIFERFHRGAESRGRSIEGTGIGLALVHELVKLHGGSINVVSAISEGATFTVVIPLGADHLPKDKIGTTGRTITPVGKPAAFVDEAFRWISTGTNRDGSNSGQSLVTGVRQERILLADDNADMREYLTRLLAAQYQVMAVSDGEAALGSALSQPPDLILSDVMMPGLDGFGLIEQLRARPETRTIPVILLSARAGEESRVEGLISGADDYLTKPFTARELFARVAAHLDMRRRTMEAEAVLRENRAALERSNEELRQANIDLEQFAYAASHDLQEPLRQIAIYSQLLAKKFAPKLDGKGAEYLNYCIEGAQRMEMLISGLLAYSQAARGADSSHKPVKVVEVLETVKKNLAAIIEETGAEISISAMPLVRGESVPLVHLFQNLLSNALKYCKERPQVTIAAARQGDSWQFSVADNGIGIQKEYQTLIFGMFKRLHDRTEYQGTGIGLAICQKIVERYGGRIWVESEPGQGSTFFFTLPSASHEE